MDFGWNGCMASLTGRFRRKPVERSATFSGAAGPDWAAPLFASTLAPRRLGPQGQVLVWGIRDDPSNASISEQFKANAGDYHQRYAASDHFQGLFRQALDATGIAVADAPLILDLGSGSGVNSIVPCQRLFPGARMVATDLSGELLELLALYLAQGGATETVLCVMMDAMSAHVTPGQFDLVTGASILHHLERPGAGIAAAARALRPGGHAIFFEPFSGYAILRLAYERILAEADLRAAPLDPTVAGVLSAMIADIAARSAPDPKSPGFAKLDDKWLFARAHIEKAAAAHGFTAVRLVPHNDHPALYRDATLIQLRLATNRTDLALPDWAMAILDGYDAAMSLQAKRELMLEGTIVLTMGETRAVAA